MNESGICDGCATSVWRSYWLSRSRDEFYFEFSSYVPLSDILTAWPLLSYLLERQELRGAEQATSTCLLVDVDVMVASVAIGEYTDVLWRCPKASRGKEGQGHAVHPCGTAICKGSRQLPLALRYCASSAVLRSLSFSSVLYLAMFFCFLVQGVMLTALVWSAAYSLHYVVLSSCLGDSASGPGFIVQSIAQLSLGSSFPSDRKERREIGDCISSPPLFPTSSVIWTDRLALLVSVFWPLLWHHR